MSEPILKKRFKETLLVIYYQVMSYVYSLYGYLKAQFFFDPHKTNRLEFGNGGCKREGFITLDLNFSTDYPFDLRFGLPFPDESIDFIYSEHTLEHFSYKDLVFLLGECRRVLKKGGKISSVVPDSTIYTKAYAKKAVLDKKKYLQYETGLDYKSKIDYLNYIFYMDGQHRHMFDDESIVQLFKGLGFKKANIRPFDKNLDLLVRKKESIYCDAVK